jgi:WD40 repeat protein
MCCVYASGGNRIVSAGDDGTVRIWDSQSGQELLRLVGHAGWVRCSAYAPEGDRIVSAGDDGTLRIWDAHTGRLLRIHALSDARSRDPGYAVWDVIENRPIEVCGDLWRDLAWVYVEEGKPPRRLPLETFGPV